MSSSLYRELSQNELTEIVSKTLHTEVCSVQSLTGGLFNTTYLVETVKCGRVILRVGPVNRHLLMPFEHRLMEAEEYVYALCARYGVPASQIIAVDTSKRLIDRDFMFVRYIPSKPMSEILLEPQEKAGICRDIGAATAKLHGIKAPRFGRIAEVKEGGGFTLWSEALLHELYEWERVGVPAALFGEMEHVRIRQLFQKAVPYLDEIKEPRLVHADLWTGNILILTDTSKPQFAAIIDADRAIWGDPDFDFSSIRWTYTEENFWEGYGRRLSQSAADQIRRGIYTLLNRLWNTYVYSCEYNQPENAIAEQSEARNQMQELCELLKDQVFAVNKGVISYDSFNDNGGLQGSIRPVAFLQGHGA